MSSRSLETSKRSTCSCRGTPSCPELQGGGRGVERDYIIVYATCMIATPPLLPRRELWLDRSFSLHPIWWCLPSCTGSGWPWVSGELSRAYDPHLVGRLEFVRRRWTTLSHHSTPKQPCSLAAPSSPSPAPAASTPPPRPRPATSSLPSALLSRSTPRVCLSGVVTPFRAAGVSSALGLAMPMPSGRHFGRGMRVTGRTCRHHRRAMPRSLCPSPHTSHPLTHRHHQALAQRLVLRLHPHHHCRFVVDLEAREGAPRPPRAHQARQRWRDARPPQLRVPQHPVGLDKCSRGHRSSAWRRRSRAGQGRRRGEQGEGRRGRRRREEKRLGDGDRISSRGGTAECGDVSQSEVGSAAPPSSLETNTCSVLPAC